MKIAKRFLIGLLAAFMSVGMVACSQTGDGGGTGDTTAASGGEVTTAPEGEEALNIPSDLKFNNEKVNVLVRSAREFFANELWVDDDAYGSDKVSDAVYARYKKIEEDYDLFVKLTSVATNDISTWYTNSSLTADVDSMYHVVADHGRNSFSFVIKSLCADWNMLPYINLDASWWSQDALKQWTTLSGSVYVMNGDISYLSVGEAVGMFFNKDLLINAEMDLPYDLVRDGEWTQEQFQYYVRTVGATLTGEDSYGYMTGWWRGPMNIVNSTGNRWISVTEDDITLISSSGNDLQDAFDDYFRFLFESGYCKMIGGDYATASATFTGKKLVFYDETIFCAPNFYQEGLNFGVVPMPKYDEDVAENYTFVNADTNIFTVPRNVLGDQTTANRVSVFLEAMAYYGQKNVMPTYFNDLLTYRSTTDVDSVEMMGLVRAGLTFDLAYWYSTGSPITNVSNIPYNIAAANGLSNFKTQYDTLNSGSLTEAIEEWKNLK